jgi:hypothetical protein
MALRRTDTGILGDKAKELVIIMLPRSHAQQTFCHSAAIISVGRCRLPRGISRECAGDNRRREYVCEQFTEYRLGDPTVGHGK